jgi:IS5 family transposase
MLKNVGVEDAQITKKVNLRECVELYGDKGFSSNKNREYLLTKGIIDKIMHKKPRCKDQHWMVRLWNKGISKTRFVVEQTFGL